MPNLRDHIVLIEEISEYLYAFDRAMFHLSGNLEAHGLAGIKLGRIGDIPENDRPFGEGAGTLLGDGATAPISPIWGKRTLGTMPTTKSCHLGC